MDDRLVRESTEESEGRLATDGIAQLDLDPQRQSMIDAWPPKRRSAHGAGQRGNVHAKLAIAGRSMLFPSITKLSNHAFLLNTELGIMIHEAALAAGHIDALIRAGDLRQI